MDEEERWTVGVKLYRKSSSALGGFYYIGLKENILIVPKNEGETEKKKKTWQNWGLIHHILDDI